MDAKQNKKFSGQAFPFLLIGIVVLIIAATTAITVFKTVRIKTCADNGTDAGALAAGSVLASAFNELCFKNKAMYEYYVTTRGYYSTLNQLANTYFREGEVYSKVAGRKIGEALPSVYGGLCVEWAWLEEAVDKLNEGGGGINSAAEYAREAAKCISAAAILQYYMEALTYNFKWTQLGNYCEAVGFISEESSRAKDMGIQYAAENSCPADDGSWGAAGSITIDLPILEYYDLKHTFWNYPKKNFLVLEPIYCAFEGYMINVAGKSFSDDPFNAGAADLLATVYFKIADALEAASSGVAGVWGMTIGAYWKPGPCCVGSEEPPPGCVNGCVNECSFNVGEARRKIGALNNFLACVKNSLVNLESGGSVSINTLLNINQEIWQNVWKDAPEFFESHNCSDASKYNQDGTGYQGLMIIKIDDVKFDPDWKVHAYTSSTSSAAEFKYKGVLRDFKAGFDTQITETD
jgi:hypothetical protein